MIEYGRKDCITFTYEPGECMKNGLCYQFVGMNCLAPGKTVNYNLPHTLSHTIHTDLTDFWIFPPFLANFSKLVSRGMIHYQRQVE